MQWWAERFCSGGRGTCGGVSSTRLGPLLYEIGRLFNLDYTYKRLMGQGFDDVIGHVLGTAQRV